MTIRSVSALALDLPFEIGAPKPTLAGKPRSMEMLLLRVETAEGIVGWGEAFGYAVWPATRTAVETLVAPLAIGRDEHDIPGLMMDLQRKLHLLGRTGPVIYALSGLDIALWDIAGKAAGKPVADLLGGVRHRKLPAYASLMRYGDPQRIAHNAAAAIKQGYGAIKLHETGTEQVRAARAAIGDDAVLMLDASCAWSVDEALSMAAQLDQFHLHWLEEPIFPPEDHAALARVRQAADVRLAAGENAISATDFQAMFNADAVDFAQPSVTKIGGITEMMRVAKAARENGVALMPHSPYFGPGLLATVHVAATLETETMIEYSFCELGASPCAAVIGLVDGTMALPSGPGLGCDPDPRVLDRYLV